MQAAASRFLEAILSGNRALAYRIGKECLDASGVAYLHEDVVAPALREVGELWAADSLTVADEHLASATAASAVAALYPFFPWPATRSARVLVACPQGERHAFGARMLSDLLALDGWEDFYFGADVPTATLARKVVDLRPAVVALSVTLTSNLQAAREAMQQVRDTAVPTRILLGGRAVRRAPDLAASLGADAMAQTARQAIEVIREWR